MSRHRLGLWLLAAGLAGSAHAANWTVCDYTVRVDGVDRPARELRATVQRAAQANPGACVAAGTALQFRPETADYQSELPRKHWPRVGSRVALRTRHLDGICKNDGHSRPCRISHHSILARR